MNCRLCNKQTRPALVIEKGKQKMLSKSNTFIVCLIGFGILCMLFALIVAFAPKNPYRLLIFTGRRIERSLKSLFDNPDNLLDRFPLAATLDPIEGNRIWNHGQDAFNLIKGAPLPLSVFYRGDKARLEEPKLIIELPCGFEISCAFAPHDSLATASEVTSQSFERSGQSYTRFTIVDSAAMGIIKKKNAFLRAITVIIEPNTAEVGDGYKMYWHLENGAESNKEQAVTINVLPPLNQTPNPKRFMVGGWRMPDLYIPRPEIRKRVFELYEEASIKASGRSWRTDGLPYKVNQQMKQRGWWLMKALGSGPLYSPGGVLLVDPASKEVPGHLCPTYVLTDKNFQERYRDEMKRRITGMEDGEVAMLDFESWGVYDTRNACFNDLCIDAFAQFANLPRTKLTNAKTILRKYHRQWAKFRSWQVAECCKLFAGTVRALNPNLKVGYYDYVIPDNQAVYKDWLAKHPMDTRLYDRDVDMHAMSFYHHKRKSLLDALDFNAKILKKPVWVMPFLNSTYNPSDAYTTVTPEEMRMDIIASAATGAHGCIFYPGNGIDGRYFHTIDQGMQEVATCEDFYFSGNRVDDFADVYEYRRNKYWQKYLGYRVHELHGRWLLTLLNYHDSKPCYVEVKFPRIPEGEYILWNPITKTTLSLTSNDDTLSAQRLRKGVRIKILPMSPKLLIVEEHKI